MLNKGALMRKRYAFVLIFGIGVILSSLYLYRIHSIPLSEEKIIILASYYYDISYDYIVFLKPNNVYNVSFLRAGEGIIYRRITDFIDFNMSYSFGVSTYGDGAIRYVITLILESPAGWERTICNISEGVIPFNGKEVRIIEKFKINPNAYWDLIEAIEKETGTSSSKYTIKIVPRIHVYINTNVGLINEYYSPELNIVLDESSENGDIIIVSDGNDSGYKEIKERKIIYKNYLISQRYLSYFLISSLSCGLVYFLLTIIRSRPKVKSIEKTIGSINDILANIVEEPLSKEGYTIVRVSSLEDLIKVSDNLLKPILLAKRENVPYGEQIFTFYVIDGSTRYEYEIKEKVTRE